MWVLREQKRCGAQFGEIWSKFRGEISVLGPFRDKNVIQQKHRKIRLTPRSRDTTTTPNFLSRPDPYPNAPRDEITRAGKPLTPTWGVIFCLPRIIMFWAENIDFLMCFEVLGRKLRFSLCFLRFWAENLDLGSLRCAKICFSWGDD